MYRSVKPIVGSVLVVLMFFMMLFFNTGCTDKADDNATIAQTKSISGYVIDDPVSGATVEIYDDNGNLLAKEENATDNSGHFSISIPQDKFSSPILKVIAYKNNGDVVLSAYDNTNKNREVYVTQDTTALINKLVLDNVKVVDEYFKLKEQYGFVNGKIANVNSYEAKKIKYIATRIEHSFKNNLSYSVFSDDNLTEKSLDITQGSIFDFSVLGYNSLDCNGTSKININNVKVTISTDLNNSQTIKCIAKNTDNNSLAFYNINLIPSVTKVKSMPAAKKILSFNDIQIVKPSNDDIQIKNNKDSTIVVKNGDKVLQAKSLLSFYPDGKVLEKPLNLKIPGVENNNSSFYLISKDGAVEKIDSNYSNGFYYVSVPHFTDVGYGSNINITDKNSNTKIDYSKIKTNILSEDSKMYIKKADISYPKILLKKGYTETSLKDNLDVQGLLALLVLKNGKGLIDFDGSNINFNNGSIKFGVTGKLSNEESQKQNDASLFFNVWNKITSNIITLSTNDSIEKLVDENKNSKVLIKSVNKTLNDSIKKYQKELNQFNNDINELEKKSLSGELSIQQLDSEIDKLQNKSKSITDNFVKNKIQTKTTKLFIRSIKRKIAKPISLSIKDKQIMKNRFIKTVNRLNKQIKNIKLKSGKLSTLKTLNTLVKKVSKLKGFTFSSFRKLSAGMQLDNTTKFFGFNSDNTAKNAGKLLGILGFVAKTYSVSLDYNFKQTDDKVAFLDKLKVYFPEYSDDIQKLIDKLIVARKFDYPALKQLYTYLDNATGSLVDRLDSYNDIYGLITLSSKFSKFLEEKGLSAIGSGLSIANSFGQAYKTWSAANSLAYMSATASTLAYKISVNKNLSLKEQSEWYALFQTISNSSLVGWYYSDGKMAEKGDNWMYVVGNAFDVGLTAASDPTILGLADAALKSVLNEQIVSTVWSAVHGINSFRSEYNSEDELIAKYITRNATYKKLLHHEPKPKKAMSIPINNVIKLPDGSKVLSIFIKKGTLTTMGVRFDRTDSDLYMTDLLSNKSTSASSTWWNFKGKKQSTSEADKKLSTNPDHYYITGAPLNPKEDGVLNIVVGKNINKIEILGWKKDTNKTKAYAINPPYIDIDKLHTTTVNSSRIDKIIDNLQKNLNFQNSNDKKNIPYLKNSGYTVIDLTTNNCISYLSEDALSKLYIDSYIAMKYYNQQQYSVAILKFKDKIYYFVKDYIFDEAKNNFQDIPNTTITTSDVENILKIKYPISMLKEEVNSNKGVFNATYIYDFFTDLDSKIAALSDKIRKITTSFKIYDKNGKDITSDYYNDTVKCMYIDRNFDKEFGKISIHIESLKGQAVDTNNLYINKIALKDVKGISTTAKDMKNISIVFNSEFLKNNKGIELSYKEDGNLQNLKSIKFSSNYSYPYISLFDIKNEQECTTNGNCTLEIKEKNYITDISLVLNDEKTLYQKECKTESCPLSYNLQYNLPTNKNNKIKLKMCNHSSCTTKTLNITSLNDKFLEALNICESHKERDQFNNISQAKQYYYDNFTNPVLDYCVNYKKEKGTWSNACKKTMIYHDGVLELQSQYRAESDLDGDGIPNFLDIGTTDKVFIRKDKDYIIFAPSMKEVDVDHDGVKDYDEIIKYRYKNKLTLCPSSKTWAIFHGNYILSDNIIAAILDNKLKDYPFGNPKKLLDLKRNHDFDHDGISDFKELYYFVNNNIVYNEDGLIADYSEDLDSNLTAHNYSFKEWYKSLNPFSKDTDGDGFSDKQEINDISQGNPLINNDNDDFDGDGLSNKEEFTIGTNPLLKDSDYDGVDDKTEVELSKNPNYKDQHISPTKKNNFYIDSDKDGIIDICETYPEKDLGIFATITDGEGNSYSDINCSERYLDQKTNSLKADTDGDGMPDGYERKKEFCTGEKGAYSNGKPLWKCYDNSRFDATVNDSLSDFDKDGLPNLQEYKYGTNPYDFSSKVENISDGFAIKYDIKDYYDDEDGDGITNLEEYQQDTDPTQSYVTIRDVNISGEYYPKYEIIVNAKDWNRVYIERLDNNKTYEVSTHLISHIRNVRIVNSDEIDISSYTDNNVNARNIIIKYDKKLDNYCIANESDRNIINKPNVVDYTNLMPLYIDDLNMTNISIKSKESYFDYKDGNLTSPMLPGIILWNYDPSNTFMKKEIINLSKDSNGIPFIFYRKFWQQDANKNGINDKDEYNNTRNEYVDIDAIKNYDGDSDGLSDLDELYKYYTNPFEKDSDGDGLDDGKEIKIGTDPTMYDTDGDGLPDGYEISHKNKKRLVVVDLSLYNNTTTMDDKNISVVDKSLLSYAQNFAEGNETKPSKYSSASHFEWSNDGDGNITAKFKQTGKVYHFKYKSTPTDPLKYDSDGDGMGDGYEVAFHLDASDANDKSYSPAMILMAGKTVSYSNGYQFNPFYLIKPQVQKTNLQNYQNKYNPLISVYNPFVTDTDKDGLSDAAEYFWKLNPKDSTDAQKDSDKDGLSNKEEILYNNSLYIDGLDPHNSDTDGDGLPDGWEVSHGSDPYYDSSSTLVSGKDYTYSNLYNGKITITADKTNGIVPPALTVHYSVNIIGATPPYTYFISFGDSKSESGVWKSKGNYSFTHTYSKEAKQVGIQAIDKNGNGHSISSSIGLNITQNKAPVINNFASNIKIGDAPLDVNFTYDIKDPESDSVNCYLDINGDNKYDATVTNCTNGMLHHTFSTPGNYNIVLHAIDKYNNESNATVSLAVNKRLIELTADSSSGYAPKNIAFQIKGVDVDRIESVDWDFGDGNIVNNKEITSSHDFSSAGDFEVGVKVHYIDGKSDVIKKIISIFSDDINVSVNTVDLPYFSTSDKQISFADYNYSIENGGLVVKDTDGITVGTLVYDSFSPSLPRDLGLTLSSSNDYALYIDKNRPDTLYILSSKAIKTIDISDKNNPKLVGGITFPKSVNDYPGEGLGSISSYHFYNDQLAIVEDMGYEDGKDIVYIDLPTKNYGWGFLFSKFHWRGWTSFTSKFVQLTRVKMDKSTYTDTGNEQIHLLSFSFIDDNLSIVSFAKNTLNYATQESNTSYKICIVQNKKLTSTCIENPEKVLKINATKENIIALHSQTIDVYDNNLTLLYTITRKASKFYGYNYYDMIIDHSILKVKSRYCEYQGNCSEGSSNYFKILPDSYEILIPTDNAKALVSHIMLQSEGSVYGMKLLQNNSLALITRKLQTYQYTNEGGDLVTGKHLVGPAIELYNPETNQTNLLSLINTNIDGRDRFRMINIDSDIYFLGTDNGIGHPFQKFSLENNTTTLIKNYIPGARDTPEFYMMSADSSKNIYIIGFNGMLKYDSADGNITNSPKDDNNFHLFAYGDSVPYFYNNYVLVIGDSFDRTMYVYDRNEYSNFKSDITPKKTLYGISGHIFYSNNDYIVTDDGVSFTNDFNSLKDQDSLDQVKYATHLDDLKIDSNYIFGVTDKNFIVYKIDLANKKVVKMYQMSIPKYIGNVDGKKVIEINRQNHTIYIGGNGYLLDLSYAYWK